MGSHSITNTIVILSFLLQGFVPLGAVNMATEAAVHKRNLESSILFMQQEHATTLKALHEEIQKLQKRCTGRM